MMLLQGSMPDQQWSPQTSGIEIKQNYRETLADLWESGEGKHAVEQFFNWYLANQFNPQGWHKDYVETCELVDQIKNGKEITKQDVKKLWYDVSNGIASVGQGFMYQREFDANYEFLLGLTREILANPTEQTYQKVLKDWKQSGTFERVLWGVIHRVFAAADPQHYTSVVAQAYVNDVYTCLKQQYQLHTKRSGSWFSDNRDLLELTAPFLTKDIDVQTRNILLWSLYEWKATNKNEDTDGHDQVRDNEANYEVSQSMINSITKPLNQILYGPPGTGKTYHTIEAAVTAAEPTFVWTNRSELKEKYDQLVTAKRIRFVTFHQSYGYEEFVEGLRAESDNDGNLSYPIKDGVFKSISDEAAAQKVAKPELLSEDARIWQLSIESSGHSEVKQFCLENNLGSIGWGHVGDMTPAKRTQESDDVLAAETTPNQATLRHFCNSMAIGDVVFCVSGQKTIEAIGVVSGDYEFRPDGISVREDYCHVRPIKWLAKGLNLNVYDLNCQTRLPIKTCSELTRFSVPELLTLLNKKNILLDKGINQDTQRFVLVIDEINRGNISKIFGELITLIEPSKRADQPEALELVLPYSGKAFSVPDNLHIIGTMNTADRSLAMMDTALRRRFDFVEMMPKPELLESAVVKGIDLQRLLEVLNQRIEILYDREHTLGHAFLMPVKALVDQDKEELAFSELQSVFQNKIIPLLEEYFFEDWSKIRLVLADNQKPQEKQFIKEHVQTNQELNALFGVDHNLDQYGQSVVKYELADKADEVWCDAESYIGIYSKALKTLDENQEFETSREMVTEQ
ncbi:AAA domain-containing protein [Photobacterium damselae subsp. damselae]|nr:AAA domain-containing protein [Photobacterium damselae subsp. damselae]